MRSISKNIRACQVPAFWSLPKIFRRSPTLEAGATQIVSCATILPVIARVRILSLPAISSQTPSMLPEAPSMAAPPSPARFALRPWSPHLRTSAQHLRSQVHPPRGFCPHLPLQALPMSKSCQRRSHPPRPTCPTCPTCPTSLTRPTCPL